MAMAEILEHRPRHSNTKLSLQLAVLCLTTCLCCCLGPGAVAISNVCFEKIYDGETIYMQEHPARNKAVIATKEGKLTLVTLPGVGKGAMKPIGTYLDLTKRVQSAYSETGLLSFAFHPKFMNNGRFFISYICNAKKHPDCKTVCGCNSAVGCTVGKRNAGCFSTTVIAEYLASGSPKPNPKGNTISPRERRRTLTFARPYLNHNGGHIFFGKDTFLYLSSGDGGSQGDPWNLAQNTKSFFGKVMRMNVDATTAQKNYTIPKDNPFQGPGENALIYALGLRNPWRCDQDPVSGAIACGDVGANKIEEVNLIINGGNYMWSNFEGSLYTRGKPNDTSKMAGSLQDPKLFYTHSDLGGKGCIIGGVFYRSKVSPCLQGKYLYADHSGAMLVASLGATSTAEWVSFDCSPTSPIKCPPGGDGSVAEWGAVNSWARDIAGNAYMLTTDGIYRVANQSLCPNTC